MKRGKKSIVMALSDLRGGGAERVVVNLLNHWPSGDIRPVLLLAERKGAYVDDLCADIEVLSADLRPTAANTIRVLTRTRALLTGMRPAAIFSHSRGITRMLMRIRATGALAAPLVPVIHNGIGAPLSGHNRGLISNWIARRELQWMYSRAARVVTVSRGIAREAIRTYQIPESKVETIPNPVDLSRIDSAVAETPADHFVHDFRRLKRPVVLSVGRLSRQKNHALLLDAYAALPLALRGSLVILGEGELKDDLRSRAASLGIGDEVVLPGFVPNPWWYMKHSDLYVMSSNWEGYPMVLIEALACGVPIIATDCQHGPSEILKSKAFGSLVPTEDRQALATAIAARLRAGKHSASREVREFLEQSRPEAVAGRYQEVLKKL